MYNNFLSEQIKDRIRKDDRYYNEGIKRLADTVSGRSKNLESMEISGTEDIVQIKNICLYLGQEIPDSDGDYERLEDYVDYFTGYSGIMKRHITLEDKWYKDGDGVLLAVRKEDGSAVALYPGKFKGYYYIDNSTGRKVKITRKNCDIFEDTAYSFYKPLPMRKISSGDYLRFVIGQIKVSDLIMLIVATGFITLVGMLTPKVTKVAFSDIVPSNKKMLLIPLAFLFVATAVGSWLLNAVKSSVSERLKIRMDAASQNAMFSRVLRLPATFFTNKSAGGLGQQLAALSYVPGIIAESVIGGLLTVAVSLCYLVQLTSIAKELLVPALTVYFLMMFTLFYSIRQEKKLLDKQRQYNSENNSLVFDLISGIEKLKVSGSEKRAYNKWLGVYTKKAGYTFAARFPSFMRPEVINTINLLGILWFYIVAYNCKLSIAEFAAFNSSFGLAMAGVNVIGTSGRYLANFLPSLKAGEEIFEAEPEASNNGKLITSLRGAIEINNLYFRYSDDSPLVVDGLSLSIKPGEYVAFVGKSGCGKSTLIKLMLGFLTPREGAIYYDNMDLDTVDKRSLRRCIGTVLQNGKLFAGDIYSNITISAPWLTEEEAWKAAEMAGMAEDIRLMPKGMQTMVSEGSGGISGGQRQRLVIARAIAPNPKILIFDEATSALDNITQKKVTESLNTLNCTRIVIAHRLSTIRDCDRIICLDKGKIIEEGTYDELIANKGFFSELVSRQLIDAE